MNLTSEQKDANIRAIDGVIVYKNDVEIVRKKPTMKRDNPQRMEVEAFSDKSRNRLAFIASNTDVVFRSMITLTYPGEFETDGKAAKRHLDLFLKRWRRQHDDSYLWFLEFQMRGAPHYHYLTTVAASKIDKRKVSRDWFEIVASDDRKHLLAGTKVESLRKPGAWYALKYAGKMTQKNVPENYRNVGRFYGYSRDVKPMPIMAGQGDLTEIFQGHENYQELLEAGFRVIFKASGTVASNLIQKGNMKGNIDKSLVGESVYWENEVDQAGIVSRVSDTMIYVDWDDGTHGWIGELDWRHVYRFDGSTVEEYANETPI